jgi:hypothetical protein
MIRLSTLRRLLPKALGALAPLRLKAEVSVMSQPKDDAASHADSSEQVQAKKSGKTEVAGVLPIHPPGVGNDDVPEHPWDNKPGGKDDDFEKDGKNRKEPPWTPGPTRNA